MANLREFLLLPKLPSKDFLSKEAYDFIQRDIYVDVSTVLISNFDWNFVYADVLAWPSTSRTSVILPDGGAISLYTRQFTSDTPVTLEISARSQDEAKLIVYASFLDQPISFTTPTATKITPLDLGAGAVIKLRTGPPASDLLHITTYRTLMGIASFPSCLLDSIASHRSSSGCPPVSLRLSRSMNMARCLSLGLIAFYH
ncbi:hypothetical protein A0H81_03147 [Grifola frondosa]|uniref:Uncharacterized protein n=1 Tax=Grifola frondosa TaxID=5627 RepID=A0A1C7MI76_GRIFR|nr:hypothetical protein A0H81_03147 [Grifola frondosa]